jgi:hypothetical protein
MNLTQEIAKVKANHQAEEEIKNNQAYHKVMAELGIEEIKF